MLDSRERKMKEHRLGVIRAKMGYYKIGLSELARRLGVSRQYLHIALRYGIASDERIEQIERELDRLIGEIQQIDMSLEDVR